MTSHTQSLTEEELIITLQGGDQQAFEKFYHRFSQPLYSTIMRWINDAHVAENLLQDAFVKAWISREAYDPAKGRLFTWLFNITRNICIDYFRSRQYKKGKAAMLNPDISSMLGAQKLVSQLPDTIGVRKLLDMLRNEEKQVVELMYFKGLTQKRNCDIDEHANRHGKNQDEHGYKKP